MNYPCYFQGTLSVYGQVDNDIENGFEEADAALQSINALHSTVIMDSSLPPLESARIVVSNMVDVEKVADRLIVNSLNTHYSIPADEQMTAEFLASLLSGKAVGTEKSHTVFEVFKQNVTVDELQKIIQSLENEQKITATFLDRLTGEVTGFATSYFKRNVSNEDLFYPFLLEDQRDVLLAGKNIDIRLVLNDGKTLYPAEEILGKMGYTVTSNAQSLYIENDVRKFRFSFIEPFYVYNERKYDLVSSPFERIEGEFYFEENWFIRLFLVGIEKTADTINIVPTAMFEGRDSKK